MAYCLATPPYLIQPGWVCYWNTAVTDVGCKPIGFRNPSRFSLGYNKPEPLVHHCQIWLVLIVGNMVALMNCWRLSNFLSLSSLKMHQGSFTPSAWHESPIVHSLRNNTATEQSFSSLYYLYSIKNCIVFPAQIQTKMDKCISELFTFILTIHYEIQAIDVLCLNPCRTTIKHTVYMIYMSANTVSITEAR